MSKIFQLTILSNAQNKYPKKEESANKRKKKAIWHIDLESQTRQALLNS